MRVSGQLRWVYLLSMLLVGMGNAHAQKGSTDAVAAVRGKLASARKALTDKGKSLDEQERRSLDEALTQAENALKRYEDLARRGNARKEAMAPLVIAGGGILADDATGVGVADDVLLPFIALGAAVAYVSTRASASDAELNTAWTAVLDNLRATSQVAERVASRRKAEARFASAERTKVPKANVSDKEGAKDVPSWARGQRPRVGESGRDFARRLLDEKYGPENYPTGPGTEFSKIQKWGDRSFEDPK